MRVVLSLIFLLIFTNGLNAYSSRAVGEDASGRPISWFSYNWATALDADIDARTDCMVPGLSNCRITHRWSNICVATSVDGLGVEHIETSSDLERARLYAAQLCSRSFVGAAGTCRPGIAFCDTSDATTKRQNYATTPTAQHAPPGTRTVRLREYVWEQITAFVQQLRLNQWLGLLIAGPGCALILFVGMRQAAQDRPPPIVRPPTSGARFQASIQHSQRHNGFYIHLTLLFTQDSINLIRARRLEPLVVVKGWTHAPFTWLGAKGVVYGWWAISITGLGAAILGILMGFRGYNTALHVIVGGIVAMILGFVMPRIALFNQRVHEFSIRDFMRKPTIRLWGYHVLAAQEMDAEIRDNLQKLRAALDAAVHVPPSETFDV